MSTADALVAFLTARLAEDEAAALAAGSGEWVALDGGVMSVSDETWPVASTEVERDREVRVHIARHDPSRVLREIEAKRKILAEHQTDPDVGCITTCKTCDAEFAFYPCRTLRLLAVVYRDHPDYDGAWR